MSRDDRVSNLNDAARASSNAEVIADDRKVWEQPVLRRLAAETAEAAAAGNFDGSVLS